MNEHTVPWYAYRPKIRVHPGPRKSKGNAPWIEIGDYKTPRYDELHTERMRKIWDDLIAKGDVYHQIKDKERRAQEQA